MTDRSIPTNCIAADCRNTTRDGKPYCPQHVLSHDYPMQVYDYWNRISYERDELNKGIRPQPNWCIIEEVLLIVSFSELICHQGKIARELGVDLERVGLLCQVAGLKAVHSERTVVYQPEEGRQLLVKLRASK